jgi:hypothetical protein
MAGGCVDSKRNFDEVGVRSSLLWLSGKTLIGSSMKYIDSTAGRRRRDDTLRRRGDGDRKWGEHWSWSYQLCWTVEIGWIQSVHCHVSFARSVTISLKIATRGDLESTEEVRPEEL